MARGLIQINDPTFCPGDLGGVLNWGKPQMEPSEIAYLALVLCAFGAFMIALAWNASRS
jgi:hypothetical protein